MSPHRPSNCFLPNSQSSSAKLQLSPAREAALASGSQTAYFRFGRTFTTLLTSSSAILWVSANRIALRPVSASD